MSRLHELKKNTDLSTYDRCVYLLCEARCFEGLNNFRRIARCLEEVRQLDAAGDFSLDIGFIEVYAAFAGGAIGNAIDLASLFLNEHRKQLSNPEYIDKAHALEQRIAFEMVNDGQYERASKQIQDLLIEAKKEDRGILYLYLGVAYEGLGQDEQAIQSYEEVLREACTEELKIRAHYHLGAQYLKRGASAWAKQHFTQLEDLELPPDILRKDVFDFLARASALLGEEPEKLKYQRLSRQSRM